MRKPLKIKILYIHDRPSGGAGESLYQMIYKNSLWKTKGIFFGQGGFLKEKFKLLKSNVIIDYCSTRSWLSSVRNVKWLFWPTKIYQSPKIYSFYKKIKGFVKEQQIDIIHTNTLTILEGGMVGKHLNIPHFIQVRELIDLDFYNYAISKKRLIFILNRYSNVIIANSNRTKSGLITLGVKNEKIRVIYNPVNEAFEHLNIRQKLHLGKDVKIVAIVGWIRPIKRIEDFIEISTYFENKADVKFVIIGGYGNDQKYNLKIQQMIEKSTNIIHTGILENVTNYMNSFDVLISTCGIESFGRTVAEAIIEGTPAIGINGCAVAEIIKHKKSGFVVNEFDIKGFVKYTKLLLDDKALNSSMGEFGKRDVKERFGIETIRKQFLELYKEHINNN